MANKPFDELANKVNLLERQLKKIMATKPTQSSEGNDEFIKLLKIIQKQLEDNNKMINKLSNDLIRIEGTIQWDINKKYGNENS